MTRIGENERVIEITWENLTLGEALYLMTNHDGECYIDGDKSKEILSAGKIAQELVKRGFLLCYDDPEFLNGTFKADNKAIPIRDVEDILEQIACSIQIDLGMVREIKFRVAMDVILDQIKTSFKNRRC